MWVLARDDCELSYPHLFLGGLIFVILPWIIYIINEPHINELVLKNSLNPQRYYFFANMVATTHYFEKRSAPLISQIFVELCIDVAEAEVKKISLLRGIGL